MPKASAPGLHQRNWQRKQRTLRSIQLQRVLSESADFFGASPVASALGNRLGATPHGRSKTTTKPPPSHPTTALRPPHAASAPRPCARPSSPTCSPSAELPWWPDTVPAVPSRQTTVE